MASHGGVGCPRPLPCVPEPRPPPQGLSGKGWGAPVLCSLWPVFPQSYLHTFAYQNTIYLDLWNHLQWVSKASPLELFYWGPEML